MVEDRAYDDVETADTSKPVQFKQRNVLKSITHKNNLYVLHKWTALH